MVYNNIQLFLENNRALTKVKGSWGMYGMQIKTNALTCTMRNQRVDIERVNLALETIKKGTSIFSNFRGINKLTTAITISQEENITDSLRQMLAIYNKLKENFYSSEYLIIATQIIFNARYRVSIDDAIRNTKIAYDYMKKNHRFLTSNEDIANAAIVATTSYNIEETFVEIEKCYEILKANKISSANNIQALSHILSLINLSSNKKCEMVLEMDRLLRSNKIPLKYYYLPILGIVSFITDNKQEFAEKALSVSNTLKRERGFGNFTFGAQARNMLAIALVSMEYVNNLDENIKNTLIDNTNNIALTVTIAMQTAIIAATTASTVAAASSSS